MSEQPFDDLDRRIAAALKREPDDEALLRVLEGTASPEEERAVAASEGARARLEILRQGLADAAAPSPLERAARYVFRVGRDLLDFLRGATGPLPAPQTAWATRSSPAAAAEPVCEVRHDFGELDATVRVEQVTRGAAQPTLDLQVRLTDHASRPVSGGRVTLRREGKTMDSVPTDAAGAAIFTGLSADRYDLEVRATGHVVGVMVLEFLAEEE